MSESPKSNFENIGQPFRIAVSDEDLADLAERLRRTRLPKVETGAGWSSGTTLGFAERLLSYWRDQFDWRAQELRFNRFDHRIVDIDGQAIHVLVEPGSGPDPLPLLLANGWPSSFVEYDGVIERLAHPERFGGRVEDAFTVVIPSMPGYGFSPPPPAPVPVKSFAALWDKLMVNIFGFDRYVAAGSDWGSILVSCMSFLDSTALRAVLLTTGGGLIDPTKGETPPTQEELDWLAKLSGGGAKRGYQAIQATKPQSLAFGQTDSPIGLAAWITEKFQDWTCPATQDDPPFAMDDLISNVMIYWLNGCAAPMWLYAFLHQAVIPVGARANVPAGFMLYPCDLATPPPRSILERAYDVQFYRLHEKGGHFPAQEVPDLFVDDITSFFRQFR